MQYEISYSNRRTVTIKVKDGKILVLAPNKIKREEIEKLLLRHKRWIDERLSSQMIKNRVFDSLSEEDIKKIKRSARIYLTDLTEKYSKIMGAEYSKVRITSAKTRFGSCTSQKSISYSYRLMFYPEKAREYVVVHELAHTFEMNHSDRFYKIIESVLPDYRERKKLLKMPDVNIPACEM